ncbi:DUF115 domain-containing protein [Kiritimatiellaeota bacterium B1221]|nr:DUF115 domain-containing protein [Kiritimatiellaeota bacterium B1221]
MSLKHKFRRQLATLQGQRRFEKLKNKHQGQVGLVVGNGPSLKFVDLENLASLVSIASNKIYLGFDNTSWRPDYFSVVDKLIADEISSEAPKYFDEIFCSKAVSHHFPVTRTCAWTYKQANDKELQFSSNISEGIGSGYTVTYENIQFAVHLGLNPIYLIGCDHYFIGDEDKTNGVAITANEAKNHFIKGYRKPGAKVNPAMVNEMTEAYDRAGKWAQKNEWKIYNATRGGHLEAFPRVNVEEILTTKKRG